MKALTAPPPLLLLLLFCALLVGANSLTVSADDEQTAEEVVWAQSVTAYQAGTGSIAPNWRDPDSALGPVDARVVALGNATTPSAAPDTPTKCEAYIILNFGKHSIVDGKGDDLTIYESAVGSFLEPTWVYVGGGSLGAGWRYVGEAAGGKDSLDIGHVAGAQAYFSNVALCDVPDLNSGGPGPGPDIDAVAANNSSTSGLSAQAQGPGWSIERDPARAAVDVFAPMPVFEDLLIEPRVNFRFSCPKGEPLATCTAYLIIKSYCGGNVAVSSPAIYIYPIPHPSLRDLLGGYEAENVDTLAAYCLGRSGKMGAAIANPIAVFSLQEGRAGYSTAAEAWRFELMLPMATLYSAGKNDFTAMHDPGSGESTIRVLKGGLEIDPTAVGEDSFPLAGGQEVVITEDGPGPVIDLDQIYLPVAMQ